MPVAQEISDIITEISQRAASIAEAQAKAIETAVAKAVADEKAKFDALVASIEQDHADTVGALKTAIAQLTPPA